MSNSQTSELENKLSETRLRTTDTVSQLAQYTNFEQTKKRIQVAVLEKLVDLGDRADNLLEKAWAGDKTARKILAACAGVSVGVLLLVIRRIFR